MYLLLEPIYWAAFDPPVVARDTPAPEVARMVLRPGFVAGAGLAQLLGESLFDQCVDDGLIEPIP